MNIKNVKDAYCIKCGNYIEEENLPKGYRCTHKLENGLTCGSPTVVLGSNYIRDGIKDSVICTCLCNEWSLVMHMDFANYSKNVYKCSNCNNHVTIDTYR